MNPRVVDHDFARERAQQRQQRTAQIAEANEREGLSVQEKRIVVVTLEFLADAQRGIGFVHSARQGDRHAEDHLGYRTSIHRRRRKDGYPAAMAFGVIDVRRDEWKRWRRHAPSLHRP